MSYEVGERLGFGITLILAVEVSKGLVINLVPICGELLWVEIFLNLNLLFCLLALFETCVVLFLAFPYRIWHSTSVCYFISFFRCFHIRLSRCMASTIVSYRCC